MKKRSTILDIAKELGVTPGTVSRALNGHAKISTATKQLVVAMAKKLNYNANRIASSLRSGKTHVMGVMIPSAEINFFGSVVHGIESIANMHGYNVLIFQSNESQEQEVKGIETFISARVDGILASIAKGTHNYAHYEEVKARGIPLVFFDRANDDLGIPSVVIDDFKGAYVATEHLIQQGFRRIAHISGPQHIKIFYDRLQGYQAALKANNMAGDSALVYAGDVSIEAGKAALDFFLEQPDPPDAVFAVEDFTALGVMKALKERNIHAPADFGVIGFANELFGLHLTPSLSTVDQQTVLMGREAVSLLLKICNNPSDAAAINERVVLEPLPIFRESSLKKV